MINSAKKGFTLIELLLVISIISMLASVVLSSTNSARLSARDTGRITQIDEVNKALALYYNANGTFPNYAPTDDSEVPWVWQEMVQDLNTAGLIKATFTMRGVIDSVLSFFTINQVYAALLMYYPCSIQDPLYKIDWDFPVSYGYTAINGGSGYILRAKLENTSNKILKSSKTGTFYDSNTTGQSACDTSLGFYCKSS